MTRKSQLGAKLAAGEAPLGRAQVSRARGMDGLQEFGYPAPAFLDLGDRPGDALPLPRLDHGRRAGLAKR